jgi:hypothetical protein
MTRLAAGNSRLVFMFSTAFAGPLLQLVGFEGGGVQLVGPSTVGKTIETKATTEAAIVLLRSVVVPRARATVTAAERTGTCKKKARRSGPRGLP